MFKKKFVRYVISKFILFRYKYLQFFGMMPLITKNAIENLRRNEHSFYNFKKKSLRHLSVITAMGRNDRTAF